MSSWVLSCTVVAPAHRPTPSRLLKPHIAPLVARQKASAFNQPLSFDTSSVTSMSYMFKVLPIVHLGPLLHRCCTGTPPHAFAYHPPCGSAGSKCVQPATESRYVQRHRHARNVLGALMPCAPNLQWRPLLHAACAAVARRLPPPGPQLAPHVAPHERPCDSAASKRVQSAAEPRHVQRHEHGLHVLCARRACLASTVSSRSSLHVACTAIAPPMPHALPPSHATYRPPCDSAACACVQPAAELRYLQRHGHVPDVLRALRACLASQQSSWVLSARAAYHHPHSPAYLPECRALGASLC